MTFDYIKRGYGPLFYKLKRLPIFFSDESCLDIIPKVINEKGEFIHYPGLQENEIWLKEKRVRVQKDIHYEAQFYTLENHHYLMLWLVQPDGRYWMDEDGFGIEDDSSVMFYSLLDEFGNFLKPFELFSVNDERYVHDFDDYLK